MAYKPTEKEINSVFLLNGKTRYEYLIKRIVDTEELWLIKLEDKFVLLADDNENEGIPIWPHIKYIECFICDEWKNAIPFSMPVNIWINKWIPGMINDKINIAAFPNKELKAVFIDPNEHLKHLNYELEKYE